MIYCQPSQIAKKRRLILKPQVFEQFVRELNSIAPFIEKKAIPPKSENEIQYFDYPLLIPRMQMYLQLFEENTATIDEICQSLNIPLETFSIEIHIMMCIQPGVVPLKYAAPLIKTALKKQKELKAIAYLMDSPDELSVESICERLDISDAKAAKTCRKT
jgi:hypothetical protein